MSVSAAPSRVQAPEVSIAVGCEDHAIIPTTDHLDSFEWDEVDVMSLVCLHLSPPDDVDRRPSYVEDPTIA